MATCKTDSSLQDLDLPAEFEDLTGLLAADLRAIVKMLAQRANERLLTTRREHNTLQRELWNNLTTAINKAVEPLSADRR
jgi:hypothetical protein